MYIKVNCRNRSSCIVMLCQDRTTKKWCFVNLSTEHVSTCRFDTIDAAFADLRERAEVVGYSVIENPFALHLTANAMPTLFQVCRTSWKDSERPGRVCKDCYGQEKMRNSK